ncbi:TIR domain protein [compost metagenome]
MNFKSPLSIYIIWHPDFKEGQEIAKFLYSSFCRDYNKPLNRSLGIPVYFRTEPNENGLIKEIDFEESEYNAIVPLINEHFTTDENYKTYIESLSDKCSKIGSSSKIYPIAFTKGAYMFSNKLSKINFIRADKVENETCTSGRKSNLNAILHISLLHEFCRLLLNMKKASDEVDTLDYSTAPVKLFISHSKHDESKSDALKFRDYINSETQLKTFFDANDIAYGSNFGEEIKKAVTDSALVVFQSDSYSEREWCRIEVLTAKRVGCPVVIVNAIKNGEKRTFPYMGNYPSIRLNENFDEIIGLTLDQVLYNSFTRKLLGNITDLYGIKVDSILSTYPELYSFIQLKERNLNSDSEFKLVIYPDPPLGTEEAGLLNELDDDFHFLTPTTLPSILMSNE